MNFGLKVAADIGGTFTDIAILLENGVVATHKVPSTPDDYARAVITGLKSLLDSVGRQPEEISEVLHGCTVATNAILERRGAKTGLITTRGFRDVLELRRIRVPRLYEPLYVKPEPLVRRSLRLEVTERIGADGEILEALDESEVREAIRQLKAESVEAVAVCCLHSYLNPVHERRIAELCREMLPGVFLTVSSELLPEIREYERTSTTVINSYVGPAVSSYIEALTSSLERAGVVGPLLVMQSTGGILDANSVVRLPARIVECGPAAGVIGAAFQAARSGYSDVITFDMGGTTAKAAIIEGGRIVRTDEYEVGGGISLSSRLVKGGGYALKLPVIDISEVGAGGGSLVRVDRGGAIKVGPKSAGAVPGPACYGAGNDEPTVTDANVVLGYLNPVALAGGTVSINKEMADKALSCKVASILGTSQLDAAWAVHSVAAANMMRAVKAVSTYRGRDPRDFVLMAFGGNGGVFAAELAHQLQMKRILVPPAAGVFSALGLLVAPLEFSQTHAYLRHVDSVDLVDLANHLSGATARVGEVLGRAPGALLIRRAAALRYTGQAFELSIPIPDGQVTLASLAHLKEGFEAEHQRTYGHRLTSHDGIEIVAIEVTGVARERHQSPHLSLHRRSASQRSQRTAYFGPRFASHSVEIVGRDELDSTKRRGPFVIEEFEGTTVVPPYAAAHIDAASNIVIDLID